MDSQAKQVLRRMSLQERKRAIRACDGCRRVKEKCDGGVPCRRCIRLRRKCEFLGPVARHGHADPTQEMTKLRQGSHHQVTSDLLRRINYMERLLVHYAGDIKLDSESLRVMVETAEDELPPSRKAESRDDYAASHASDYLGAELENCTVKPLENNITHYSGEFSHWNFSMRIKRWIDQCVPDPYLNENDNIKVKEYYRAEELQSPSETLVSLSSLPPRYIADFLVQSFFRHAETNYFYVEKGWLLEKLDVAYMDPSSMTRRDVGTVCIIFIILAIGTQYAYLDSQPDEDEENLHDADASPFSEDTFGVMLYQQACKLVSDVITIASLESVQACLLLGIYTLPLDTSGLSYIYLNLAVKLAIQNGMHRKQPDKGLDPAVRETRIRVWWTAYTTERRVSIFHGRPVSVGNSDIDVDMPVDRSDMWHSSTASHTSALLATLHLHGILGQIAQEISAIKKHPKHETANGLSRLLELRSDLVSWWESLPDSVTCSDQALKSSGDRSAMHLRLEYYLVRMFAGRPFILRPSGRSSTSTTPANSSVTRSVTRSVSPKKSSDPRTLLVSDCVAAALDVVDTLKLLHTSLGLARASYTEFSACRAALLIIISQCLQEKTDRIRQALRDGMVMIKIMAAGGESARSEVSLIEAFERAISRLDSTETATPSESTTESGYAQFKKWEMLWKKDTVSLEARTNWSPRPMLPKPTLSEGFGYGGARFVAQDATAAQAAALFSGTDLNLESFPQTMYEFSTMFGFGPGSESVGETSGGGGNAEGWVESQMREGNYEE
ncbi:fungal-specific transcription factor domain-containing protein [Thelonectria olida]|uniref:Fungal-specific transcription factor domain-containing protein n=1 Tax=Thelonectria olida TaxID=1576542 RepID=A0A9P9AKF3_9HYPO|nr:fungal-specific transcription factor domain-containing protein [Thelonectria olida]